MIIKLRGIQIKSPDDFSDEYYDLTEANRTADGNMHIDYINSKRKYLLTYNAMTSEEFQQLKNLVKVPGDPFFEVETYLDNIPEKVTMYAGAISRRKFKAYGAVWIWRDVTVNLIEQ